MNKKLLAVVLFITFGYAKSDVYDPEQESVRASLRNEFHPKHSECTQKFNDLAYNTGKDFHPVIQSLTENWDRSKINILNFFNPLPCGNCKETSRKIDNEINFNIGAFREEYTVDRLYLRLKEAYRKGYERFLIPAEKYIEEFRPNKEQLKKALECWSKTKGSIFTVLDESYKMALQNLTGSINAFASDYKRIGEDFDQGVKDAIVEASKCDQQGFGYCQYVYFDDYFTVFINSFKKTRREAYNNIEQALSGFVRIINDVSTKARQEYTVETAKLENCLLLSTESGTVQTR